MRPAPLLTKLLLLHLTGCSPGGAGADAGADGPPAAERYGGTAVVAGIVDLQSLNALASNETLSRTFQREVLFLPLVAYDARLEPVPRLAERWEIHPARADSLDLIFHLRRDVSWHDGVPTTADDVVFTYRRVRDPAVASSLAAAFTHYAPEARKLDGHTVAFRVRPHAEMLDGFAELPIMPAHLLAHVPAGELRAHAFGTAAPVGNGPFRFVRRNPGQEWVFEANEGFPAALGGRPYLDRLVYRVVPDQNTLLTELLTGGVDVYLSMNPGQAAQLRRSEGARLLSAATPAWTFIAWNSALPMFDTPEERRALTMALDRRAIVAALLDEYGDAGRSVVTPAHWSYRDDDPRTTLPHSREVARRLLAQQGWEDRGGDGVLRDAEGRPFRFTLKVPQGNEARRDLAQIVQAQLRELGVEVRPTVVEGNTLISQIAGSEGRDGRRVREFEAVVMGWSDGVRKDDSNLFHSRNLGGPFQIAGFSDPQVDRLLDTLVLVQERERARPLWEEYQRLLAEQAPYTVIYYPRRLVGVGRRLEGVEIDVRGELATLTRWWVPAEKR